MLRVAPVKFKFGGCDRVESARKTPTNARQRVSTREIENSALTESAHPAVPSGPVAFTAPVATIRNTCPPVSGTIAWAGEYIGEIRALLIDSVPPAWPAKLITLTPETRTGLPGVSGIAPTLTSAVNWPTDVGLPSGDRNSRVAPAGTINAFPSPVAVIPLPTRKGCCNNGRCTTMFRASPLKFKPAAGCGRVLSAKKTPTNARHATSTRDTENSAENESVQPTRPSGPTLSTAPVAEIRSAWPATNGNPT